MTDEPIDEAKLDEAIKRAGQYWYGKRDAEIAYVIHCIKIIRTERDALAAQLAARAESDALVDALASEYIDDAMDAIARLVGDPDMERVDAYDAFDYAHELARRAKAAREGGAP